MAQLIVTAVGDDRPGLVGELTGYLHTAGANILDTRMVNLRGRFAVIVLLEAADLAEIRKSLPTVTGGMGLTVYLAEQGVAPGSLCLRKQRPGRLGPPPAPIARRGLPSMAGRDGLKGGADCRLDRGEVVLVRPAPGRAVPERRNATVERREARAPVKRRAAPQGATIRCAFRRSAPLTYVRAKGKEGATPRLTDKGDDESRLLFEN